MYLMIFFIGGVAYNLMEYLWRGYSHWTMTIDGGLCLLGIFAICTKTDINYIYKVISSALLITGIEFFTGIIVNRIFNMGIWDYSDMPYNVLGQICPGYTLLWTALCIPLVAVITIISNGHWCRFWKSVKFTFKAWLIHPEVLWCNYQNIGGKIMAIVTIIGAGMMGSALAFPARENGHEVRLVGTHLDREIIEECIKSDKHPKFNKAFPKGLKYYQIEDVKPAIEGSDMIIGGVSSFGVDWFGENILPIIPDSIPVLTVTKGLMDTPEGRLLTYPQVWQKKLDELGKKLELNAVGGPCTSYELVAHDQTEVSFCGNNMDTLALLKSIMETDYYHISITNDVTGIESAVALKNGYALGIALTIGINQASFGIDSELHFNSQAAVFGQATEEMYKLLDYQGALSLHNLKVGLGDLYVTVYGGRTRLVGILLGRGMNIDEAKAELNGVTLESLVVAERVARAINTSAKKGIVDTKDFPLLMHINEILIEKKPVNIPWESFTYREEI